MARKHIRKKVDTTIPLCKRMTKDDRYVAIRKILRMKYIRNILGDGDTDMLFFVERELERGEFSKQTNGELDPCYAHAIWLLDEMSRASDPDPWGEERRFYEEYVKAPRGYKKLLREFKRIIKVLDLMLKRLSDKRG